VDNGHRLASYDTSLVVSGGFDCRTRRRNVYDKTPRRYAKDNRTAHLTARSDKSVAYVTNNKRIYSTFCTVEANYCLTTTCLYTKHRAASLRQQSYLLHRLGGIRRNIAIRSRTPVSDIPSRRQLRSATRHHHVIPAQHFRSSGLLCRRFDGLELATGQSPRPGALQLQTIAEDESVSSIPLSTHSAVEMFHDSALYKSIIHTDID